MTSPSWDPERYERYADERARPFHDLVNRIRTVDATDVVDLGCGPGAMTATLCRRWPTALVRGIDSSPDMLARARPLSMAGRLEFAAGDIADWTGDPASTDVIIANAALQWVPGHLDLLPGWVASLRPGGALAFQVPAPGVADPGDIFRAVAATRRWAPHLLAVSRQPGPRSVSPVRAPTEYIDRLAGPGITVDAWETTYYHVLTGPDPVLEWSSGTGLRPYLDALWDDPQALAEYRAEIGERLREAYPQRPYGAILPFRRIFVVASRDSPSNVASRDSPSNVASRDSPSDVAPRGQ
jgi:trans-aconitate 2-methyltransferase